MRRLQCAADRDALVLRLRSLRPDAARRWGRMSCPQMVCHLSDAFRGALGDLPPARRRDNWLTRSLVKSVALRTPLPWMQGAPTNPNIDQVAGNGTAPADFAVDCEALIVLIDRFLAFTPEGRFPPHALFGPLTTRDWSRWGWAHVDHHLRQFGA